MRPRRRIRHARPNPDFSTGALFAAAALTALGVSVLFNAYAKRQQQAASAAQDASGGGLPDFTPALPAFVTAAVLA